MALYPFLHNYTISERTSVLYNVVTQDALYYDKGRYANLKDIEVNIRTHDFAKSFIGTESFRDYIKQFSHLTVEELDFRILKMFITTKCNLNCKYCLIENNIEYRHKNITELTYKKGCKVIDDFLILCKRQKPSSKTIMLYGGEPLLNWNVLRQIIDYIRLQESKGEMNGPVELVLETNGTLITNDIAKHLAHNRVEVIVSIDGIKSVHDYYRQDKSGKGTWEAAVRGYDILRQEGCTTVVSSVFTEQYALNLQECLDYSHNILETPSIGLNLLHVLQDSQVYHDTSLNYINSYIEAFEIASELSLYVEHIMRRIRPLIEKTIRVKDCGACGKRIVSDCDGHFGICEAFVGDDRYFLKRDDISSVYCDSVFLEWNKRTVFSIPECDNCIAWAICGGGCVNNAISKFGSIYAQDTHICESSKAFVQWALKRWYKDNLLEELVARDGIHFLSNSERTSILNKLKLKYDIPLQDMSKQNEHVNE